MKKDNEDSNNNKKNRSDRNCKTGQKIDRNKSLAKSKLPIV